MNKQLTAILAGALLLLGGHTVYAKVATPTGTPQVVAQASERGEQGETDESEEQEQPVTGTPSLSAEQAKAAARAASGGTAAEEAELENEMGKLIYSVELTDGREVLVDANSGKVLKMEPADENGD